MSLDVYLTVPPTEPKEVFTANITHNLVEMAIEAGLYNVLWRPEVMVPKGKKKAWQLIMPLEEGLKIMRCNPIKFKELNPDNGWGDYNGFMDFVAQYLRACKDNPNADVSVSR